jgi:hypothetical protein
MKSICSIFRYLLAIMIAVVLCTEAIVIGNRILIDRKLAAGRISPLLEVSFSQWLPVSASVLLVSSLVYLMLIKIPFNTLPVWVLGLLSGCVALGILLLSGITTFDTAGFSCYEIKNNAVFFLSGFCFAVCAERMD